MKNEILLYQADDLTRIEVQVEEDTVWLNRQQIAMLFNRDIKTIGKHIKGKECNPVNLILLWRSND